MTTGTGGSGTNTLLRFVMRLSLWVARVMTAALHDRVPLRVFSHSSLVIWERAHKSRLHLLRSTGRLRTRARGRLSLRLPTARLEGTTLALARRLELVSLACLLVRM